MEQIVLSCNQFHQRFTHTFFVQNFAPKITKLNIIKEKLLNLLSYKKQASKILMKLTAVVNFINDLKAAFAPIFFCQKITKPNCN